MASVDSAEVNIPEQQPHIADPAEPAPDSRTSHVAAHLAQVTSVALSDPQLQLFTNMIEVTRAGYGDLQRSVLAHVAHAPLRSWKEAGMPTTTPDPQTLTPHDPTRKPSLSVAMYALRLAVMADRSGLAQRLQPTDNVERQLNRHDARLAALHRKVQLRVDLRDQAQREYLLDRLGAMATLVGNQLNACV